MTSLGIEKPCDTRVMAPLTMPRELRDLRQDTKLGMYDYFAEISKSKPEIAYITALQDQCRESQSPSAYLSLLF